MSKRLHRIDLEPVTGLVDEIVEVVWEDITKIEEATSREIEKQPPIYFMSYGLVLKDDSKRLTLACHVSNEKPNPTYREALKIPRSVIRRIRILKEVESIR
jgi:hypothetical protein